MTNQTTVYLYDPQTGINHNITSEVYSVDLSYGRSRELDEFNTGTCRVRCRNYLGNFNPYFLTTLNYLLLESGSFLLQEDGASRLILEGIGTSGSYGVMTVGRKLTVLDGAVTRWTGFLEDIDLDWSSSKEKTVTLVCADGLGRLARQQFPELATTVQQSGARLTTVLAQVDLNWVTVNSYDAGQSTLQADTISAGTNVLTYCQLVNRSEQGRFFVTRDNTLRFHDRQALVAGTVMCDFNDSASYANGQTAGKIPFSVIGVTFGAELLYNEVTVTNVGGEPQTALDTTQIANTGGVRQLDLSGLLMESDPDALGMAEYLVARCSSPEAVVNSIHVPLEKLSSANRTTVASIEIGDTVTLNWTPTPTLGAVSQTLLVEGVGYSKDINDATWMTFQLSAAPDNDFFILDNDSDNYSGASILDNDTDTQASAGVLGF